MDEKQKDYALIAILLVPVILFRVAIRVVLGTAGVIVAIPFMIILAIFGVDTDPIFEAVNNWFLTGSFKSE